MKSYNYILASASPRRRELLLGLIPSFEVLVSDSDEIKTSRFPSNLVKINARNKGLAIDAKDKIIISADTIVYMNGRYYLKPNDERDAYQMLFELSGKYHTVYSGVSIRYNNVVRTFYDTSFVKIKKMTEKEILDYIATGSPMDKAGAYGIQDNEVVEKYKGSYSNIMGLPMEKLEIELANFVKEDICR